MDELFNKFLKSNKPDNKDKILKASNKNKPSNINNLNKNPSKNDLLKYLESKNIKTESVSYDGDLRSLKKILKNNYYEKITNIRDTLRTLKTIELLRKYNYDNNTDASLAPSIYKIVSLNQNNVKNRFIILYDIKNMHRVLKKDFSEFSNYNRDRLKKCLDVRKELGLFYPRKFIINNWGKIYACDFLSKLKDRPLFK